VIWKRRNCACTHIDGIGGRGIWGGELTQETGRWCFADRRKRSGMKRGWNAVDEGKTVLMQPKYWELFVNSIVPGEM